MYNRGNSSKIDIVPNQLVSVVAIFKGNNCKCMTYNKMSCYLMMLCKLGDARQIFNPHAKRCCRFENLLAAKWLTGVTRGTLTCGCCLCGCEKFLGCFLLRLFLQVVLSFCIAIMGCKLLNISLNILSMLNMRQFLFIISFIFGSTGLHVNGNVIVSLR